MVRFHVTLEPVKPGSRMPDANTTVLHKAWKLVPAMKREGIYTAICPYWAVAVSQDHIQKSQHVTGLTRPNSHTGIPLDHDPAATIISLQNGYSMLL